MTVATGKRRLSRRVLLAGGGAAVAATAIWKFSGRTPPSNGPLRDGEDIPDLAEPWPYTDYDGWVVTVPDKRLLEVRATRR
ncbi:MAG: hypothetical protein OXF79_03065 [Chloroflexi bacterium]|nr:hypothetical protein [Chloroflexota bacterium]